MRSAGMAGWWLDTALLPFWREMQIFSQRFQARGSDIKPSELLFVPLVLMSVGKDEERR
jgi:hypothetical protein